MKPIMLHGHERAITQIKYNREGDLLFSAAKDHDPNVWYALNGERLGSFKGHSGAVWCIDVNWDSTCVITGSADNVCKIWDCETGTAVNSIISKSAVRTCGFSYSSNLFMYTTDKTMGQDCELIVYDQRDCNQLKNSSYCLKIPMEKSKITAALWGSLDETIYTGHENGDLIEWDVKAKELVKKVQDHTLAINDIQASNDLTMIVTASKDTTAKLFDTHTLEHRKTYKTERPVNSASLSPKRQHVVLGGGQDAMDVTTTSTRVGKFDARFFHLVFEEEFGRVKGHFGPINSVAFKPDGLGYSSGGEDGYVRVHEFDNHYLEFEFEY